MGMAGLEAICGFNDNESHNFHMLQTRAHGERLVCDAQGRLQKLEGFRKRIHYFFHSDEECKKVKKVVNHLLTKMGEVNFDETHNAQVNAFFNKEEVRCLSQKIFKRSKISSTIYDIITSVDQKAADRTLAEKNLAVLRNHTPGQNYTCNSQGELTALGWFGSFVYRITKHRAIDKRIKAAFNKFLQVAGASNSPIVHDKATLDQFFFTTIKSVSDKFYKRAYIPKNILEILKPEPLRTLEARLADRTQEQCEEAAFTSKDEFDLRVEKVKFAQLLGMEFKRNPYGTSGSYLGVDYKNVIQLIFKPWDESPDSSGNPDTKSSLKNAVFNRIPFVERRSCFDPMETHIAEVAASRIACAVGIKSVPKTEMAEFTSTSFHGDKVNPKRGSCQLWIHGAKSAYDELNLWDPCFIPFNVPVFIQSFFFTEARKQELRDKFQAQEYQKLAIVHILAGNTDGHPANYLMIDGKVIIIDAGWSMPHKHPTDPFTLKLMYDFRFLPHASDTFTEESKGYINKAHQVMLDLSDEIQQLYHGERAKLPQDKLKNKDKAGNSNMFRQRVMVLKWFADNNRPILEAARVRKEQDFIDFGAAHPEVARGQPEEART